VSSDFNAKIVGGSDYLQSAAAADGGGKIYFLPRSSLFKEILERVYPSSSYN
jgi:hypothetical protein